MTIDLVEDSDDPGGSAGISIVSDAMPGEFAAYGLAYHKSGAEGYFSSINFSDPKMLHSSGFVYTDIPVGNASLLPSGAFTPQLSVANFSNEAAEVTVQFATSSMGTLREFDLLGKDEHQIEDAGNHPWSVENGALSTMFTATRLRD